MNKLVLEIKALFEAGKIHINNEYDISRVEYDGGVSIEIEHHVLQKYVESFDNVEYIDLVFRQHDYIAEKEDEYYRDEITQEEYEELQRSFNELSDEFDYDTVVAVIIDNERYDITTVEMEQSIYEDIKSLDNEIKNELYDVYYEPNNNNIYFVDSGMAYSGDDKDAYEVAQIENQKIIHIYV